MQIPIKPQSNRPPLELLSIKLYSTGLKKVFTNRFYKSMNHNFGIEVHIRNNTAIQQSVHIGGCIYNDDGKTIIRWKNAKIQVPSYSSKKWDFFVNEKTFSDMKNGKYKVQFWINDKKVQKEFFTVSYK